MRVSDRCYAVTGLGYSPPWCVNAGIITGDETTLVIDTGANRLAAQTLYGYASAARPGNRLQVINTEKHFDHIGGNSFFREQGVDIWGHFGIARSPQEFQAELAEFNSLIPNPARRLAGEEAVFFFGTECANPNRRIDADTRLDLGGCEVDILLTPGHTPANISVWLPNERVLFTGDCLIAKYLPNLDAGRPSDWRTWLASLDRLESLDAQVVMAGHGPVARGPEVRAMIARVREVLHESIARLFANSVVNRA